MSAATAEERALHQRLLAGDPVAPAELAELYLDALMLRLQRRLLRADEGLLLDVVVECLLRFPERPDKYDPDKLGMFSYLLMDADGDARNALRQEQRRLARLTVVDTVEQSGTSRNTSVKGPEEVLFGDEEFELPPGLSREDVLMELDRALPDERDRKALQLMADGERHTSAFAALYGLGALDESAQRHEVKRIKDRLKKKQERLRERLTGPHGLRIIAGEGDRDAGS